MSETNGGQDGVSQEGQNTAVGEGHPLAGNGSLIQNAKGADLVGTEAGDWDSDHSILPSLDESRVWVGDDMSTARPKGMMRVGTLNL